MKRTSLKNNKIRIAFWRNVLLINSNEKAQNYYFIQDN